MALHEMGNFDKNDRELINHGEEALKAESARKEGAKIVDMNLEFQEAVYKRMGWFGSLEKASLVFGTKNPDIKIPDNIQKSEVLARLKELGVATNELEGDDASIEDLITQLFEVEKNRGEISNVSAVNKSSDEGEEEEPHEVFI